MIKVVVTTATASTEMFFVSQTPLLSSSKVEHIEKESRKRKVFLGIISLIYIYRWKVLHPKCFSADD